ncbi:MAG TPA: hypothetical protein VFY44_02100, partial [Thermoleophilaceae bacterium]|nr:hypothetical protein [Thermoleophilaceae bacterium]
VLLWIGRTFNNYYLLWPMMGAAVAFLVWAGEREDAAQGAHAPRTPRRPLAGPRELSEPAAPRP